MNNSLKSLPELDAAGNDDVNPTRKRPRAASGGGFSGDGGLRAGDSLICKIRHVEPGGYGVLLLKSGRPGYLSSENKHELGEEVLATYVCMSRNRINLQYHFSRAV